MKPTLVFLFLATVAAHRCMAQDEPITAATATITILTTAYKGETTGACASFPAKSIMNSISQTLNIGSTGTGAGAGKVTFNPFTLTKNVDNCSAMLLIQTASGTPFEELIAIVEPPKASKQPTFLIRLGLAAIATLDDSASDGTKILEKVTFEYADLTVAQIDPISQNKSCDGWDRSRNINDPSHCQELYTLANDRYRAK